MMNRSIDPPDHDELRELCAGHALGALDPPDALRLEAHVSAGCEICRAEIDEYRRTVGAMGGLLGEKPPPAGAESALLARIAEESGADEREPVSPPSKRPALPPPNPFLRWTLPIAASAVAAMSLWIAYDAQQARNLLRNEYLQLQRDNSLLTETNGALSSENEKLHDVVERVLRAQTYMLKSMDETLRASGIVFHDPQSPEDPTDDVLSVHVTGMSPPPSGQTYHAWVTTDTGEVHDLGTIEPNENGHGIIHTTGSSPASFRSIQVTLEPAGMIQRPTGRALLSYSLPKD